MITSSHKSAGGLLPTCLTYNDVDGEGFEPSGRGLRGAGPEPITARPHGRQTPLAARSPPGGRNGAGLTGCEGRTVLTGTPCAWHDVPFPSVVLTPVADTAGVKCIQDMTSASPRSSVSPVLSLGSPKASMSLISFRSLVN